MKWSLSGLSRFDLHDRWSRCFRYIIGVLLGAVEVGLLLLLNKLRHLLVKELLLRVVVKGSLNLLVVVIVLLLLHKLLLEILLVVLVEHHALLLLKLHLLLSK